MVLCFVADEWKTLVENSGPKFDVWYGWWIELFLRRNKHQQSLTPHLPNIGLLSGASAKFPWMSLTRFVNSESFTYIKILLWPLFKYRETFETQLSTVKEVEKFNWFWLNSLYLFFFLFDWICPLSGGHFCCLYENVHIDLCPLSSIICSYYGSTKYCIYI